MGSDGGRAAGCRTSLLVIGYGNTLRSDDAAGPLVADRISALGIVGVRAITCQELTPDLAAELANAISVVFVDAAADAAQEVVIARLAPDVCCPVSTHATAPRALLALAQELYGNAPAAWLLKVPAANFDHGEELSEITRGGVEAAVGKIRTLVAPVPA